MVSLLDVLRKMLVQRHMEIHLDAVIASLNFAGLAVSLVLADDRRHGLLHHPDVGKTGGGA